MTMLTPSPPRGKPEAPGPCRLVATCGKSRLVGDLSPDDFEVLRAGVPKQNGPT